MHRRYRPALILGACLAALPLAVVCARDPQVPYPEPPQVLLGDLFSAVQMARVFPDGKEFADATPLMEPSRILGDYRRQKPRSVDDLRSFVDAHFRLAMPAASPPASPDKMTIAAHIDQLWNPLTRSTPTVAPYSSLLPMPRPYVVPGGRFREMYYWDSYFTMLGLVESGRHELVEDMVEDFAHLIDTYGHIPNGVRSYYLSRSQPPFFFAMVGLLAPDDAASAYARYLPQLRREHAYWMSGAQGLRRGAAARHVVKLGDGAVLNRFWDDRDTPRDESYREDTELARESGREPHQLYRDIRAAAESGWDFGSRWFADANSRATIDTTEIAPVDLNSLMFGLERAIVAGCERAGDAPCARDFANRAAARHHAVDRYLWSGAAGAYFDYRWTRHEAVPRISAATLYPLFVAMASETQAAAVAATARRDLLKAGGMVTTPLQTGQQWDSPNGWAPLQWIAVEGLRRYHSDAFAATVACRWMRGVNRVYENSGKLVEKYDVIDTGRRGGGGEYPAQDGFGWTNGVTRRLIALYPECADAAPASAAYGEFTSTIQPRP